MRILLISHTCQSRTEGQPKAHELAAIPGIELKVLVPDRWRHYGAPRGADVPTAPAFDFHLGKVRFPWAGPAQFYLHYYPGLKRILRDFRPDIIDLWEEPWALVSAHACRLRNRVLPGAKIISETEQNIDKRLPFPFERLRRYSLRNADFVVGRNRESIDVVRRKGYAGPAEVVPNGVDAELFRPMDKTACRAALDVPPGAFVAGYVGRLVEEKGLLDLIDALPASHRSVHIIMVGAGDHQGELLRRAHELGVADRLRILPGRPLDQLPAVMNALDCFVLPSRTTPRWKEQFGRVLIEAGACSVPVIGSDSGAIPEVVGGAGLVVPERNPAALAAAIEQLRADPTAALKLGIEGCRQVQVNFTWARVAARMHAIYARLLNAEPVAPSAPSATSRPSLATAQ